MKSPSVMFDAVLNLHELLSQAVWPPLTSDSGDILSEKPDVVFDELWAIPPREIIAVTGTVDDDDQEFSSHGEPSKREDFTVTAMVVTAVPNRSPREAWLRLAELMRIFDGTLRDFTTGRPVIPDALVALGVYSWRVADVKTMLVKPDKQNVGALAEVGVLVRADI